MPKPTISFLTYDWSFGTQPLQPNGCAWYRSYLPMQQLKKDNYETGMERFFDPNNLPNFNDVYYEPTPTRTREPYPLPTLNINTEFWPTELGECGVGPIDAVKVFESFKDDNFCKCLLEDDIQLGNYQSHPHIKAPLSN